MKIGQPALTVSRLDQAADFYRDVLELPVMAHDGRATVTIGSSRLVLEPREDFDGVHHLAFGIAPADFELARTWLGQRVEPIVVDGSEVIEGQEGWNSRSVYFLGPEDIVLEFISREAHGHVKADDGKHPRLLSISEVGIGVPDVPAAVCTLAQDLGLPAFPPQGRHFAPVGGHDGLIILVDDERSWFPTGTHRAARGPVTVELAAPRAGRLSLRQLATIVAD